MASGQTDCLLVTMTLSMMFRCSSGMLSAAPV